MTDSNRPQFTPQCSHEGCNKKASNGHFCGLTHAALYAENSLANTKWCFMCKAYKGTDGDSCPDCNATPLQGTTFKPPNLSGRGRKPKGASDKPAAPKKAPKKKKAPASK